MWNYVLLGSTCSVVSISKGHGGLDVSRPEKKCNLFAV